MLIIRNTTNPKILHFVNILSVKRTHLRPTSDPPPSFALSELICTFADVEVRPAGSGAAQHPIGRWGGEVAIKHI